MFMLAIGGGYALGFLCLLVGLNLAAIRDSRKARAARCVK